MFTNEETPTLFRKTNLRLGTMVAISDALMPQFNAVAGIESISAYFSVADPDYFLAVSSDPEKYFDLFGVRFAIEMPSAFPEAFATAHGFRRVDPGYWVKDFTVRPRAFVVGKAARAAGVPEAIERIRAPDFDVRREAVFVRGGPEAVEGRAGPARLERASPEKMRVTATGPGLLVVAEHYDPGWRASIAGRSVPVLETDLAALGIVLPAGAVSVDLRFVPIGLLPGVVLLTFAVVGLLAAAAWRRVT
ncbi:MAG: hypothetical protein ACXWLM_12065 [Myxococcales bacterium]